MRKISNYFFMLIICTIIGMLSFLSNANMTLAQNINNSNIQQITDTINNDNINTPVDSVQIITDSLISEVSSYISVYNKKYHADIPKSFVKYGIDENIDICLMMAQAQIETCYGKVGIGKASSKKSLFGVYHKKYITYADAVSDYCKLLNKHYLTNTRRETDLLKRFTTTSGKRYAQNPNYEKEVGKVYRNISSKTNIKSLQKYLKSLIHE